jgi:hypothetical protein
VLLYLLVTKALELLVNSYTSRVLKFYVDVRCSPILLAEEQPIVYGNSRTINFLAAKVYKF